MTISLLDLAHIHTRRGVKVSLIAAALLTSSGCLPLSNLSTNNQPELVTTLYHYQIFTPENQAIHLDELAAQVSEADVILVGEWHTHPGVHLFQAELFAALSAQASDENRPLALSMEQFARPEQSVLDSYLAGEVGELQLQTKGKAWSNYQSDYRPLVEIAKANQHDVIAANTSQQIVRCLAQEGETYLDAMPSEQRQFVAKTLSTEASPYKDKFMASTHHMGQAASDKQYLAQTAWDDTMAESIVDYLAAHQGAQVVHTAGNFHVEGGLGIASRIHALNPALRIAIIAPVNELSDGLEGDYRLQVQPLPKRWIDNAEMHASMGKMGGHHQKKRRNCLSQDTAKTAQPAATK